MTITAANLRMGTLLPGQFEAWFESRGWRPHRHQMEMLAAAQAGVDALLIAPTGGGKTLAGFLPSMIEISSEPPEGLHTLYVSPLKALAVDGERNLTIPSPRWTCRSALRRVRAIRRSTSDSASADPPHMLLTTPESLALLLSYGDSAQPNLRTVVVDEIHAMADNKRGEQLSLCLARLQSLAPACRRVGLSATVAGRRFQHGSPRTNGVRLVQERWRREVFRS